MGAHIGVHVRQQRCTKGVQRVYKYDANIMIFRRTVAHAQRAAPTRVIPAPPVTADTVPPRAHPYTRPGGWGHKALPRGPMSSVGVVAG